MKKTALSIGIAAAFMMGGSSVMAGEIADDAMKAFVAEETALASEVNGNFTAVKDAVNGNAADIAGKADATALTEGLALKADAIALTDGLALKADATALTDGLALKADASTAEPLNTIDGNATAIAELTGGGCPDEMAAVGSLCVDKTEHGGVMAPTTGVDQRAALKSCAEAGKRLLTDAEWSMAAVAAESDADLGIVNMADGVYEWVADFTGPAQGLLRGNGSGVGAGNIDEYTPWFFAGNGGGDLGGPNAVIGFRCAK
ncbi:MAG: hypothetical protein L3J70_03035 [Gammaproteobacteria bacterium]|nr:hypothetical protein [Gammaproteobacteria bacterium]